MYKDRMCVCVCVCVCNLLFFYLCIDVQKLAYK